MADSNSIIEGIVKFRDGKKWKSRWCVMRKLSPVADCVHLQMYRDSKERQKNGQTKSSLSLQQFLGIESGFTLDKESNTLAILCEDVVPVLAFDTREALIQWRVKVTHNLGDDSQYPALIVTSPSKSGIKPGPVRFHMSGTRLCITAGVPPKLLRLWEVGHLRRYGIVDGRFCLEGGSRSGRGAGAYVFIMERGKELASALRYAATYDEGIGSRRSIVSRAGSVFNTPKFSMFDKLQHSSYGDECFHGSTRSVSPLWSPDKQPDTGQSDLDSSLPYDESIYGNDIHQNMMKRPATLTRCSSCMSKVGAPITRSSTMMSTPSAVSNILSPSWIMDSVTEKRSESDRASLYSRSSGSNSEYSIPRSVCLLEKSFESKRSSPVICCNTPSIPPKSGPCSCRNQLIKQCSCSRRKMYAGPYENYDVPKPPMPLIQEHPTDATSPFQNYYDTPKRLRKCLENDCNCAKQEFETSKANNDTNDENNSDLYSSRNSTAESQLNYINVDPSQFETEPSSPFSNYTNLELNKTLDNFESSSQILRSAGFSHEEIYALDDKSDINDIKPQLVISNNDAIDNEGYTNMEPVSSSFVSKINGNSLDTEIKGYKDSKFETNLMKRKSTSAEFIKKIEESLDFSKSNSHKDVSLSINVLRKLKNECVNDRCPHCKSDKPVDEYVSVFKVPEKPAKNNNTLVAKIKESVKIRRSSSVPNKSEKNRDSSSSNDSGVSTGSLKHHKCDFSDFELPITNSVSCKKNISKFRKYKTIDTRHNNFVKSNSSDPLRNITFHFDEVTVLTKANSCETDALSRSQKYEKVMTSLDSSNPRNSQAPSQSTSSGASDMSDYIETLSISSFSSYDVSDVKQNTASLRPRSGKEYLSIDRALLASSCNSSNIQF